MRKSRGNIEFGNTMWVPFDYVIMQSRICIVSSLNTFLGISINISPMNSTIRNTFLRYYNYVCRLPLAKVQNSIHRKLSLFTPAVGSKDAEEWIRNERRCMKHNE